MPRIATCLVCCKLERLPDPPEDTPRIPAKLSWDDHGAVRDHYMQNEDGSNIMVAEHDPLLEDFVGRHRHGLPDTELIGSINTIGVEQSTWDRMDVVTKVKKDLADITGKIFEESTFYRDEATKCYNSHNNPTVETGCIDYLTDAKRIGPKVPPKYQTFLCHMCPYQQAYVNVELRQKKGWYDPANDARLKAARDASLGRKKLD